MPVPKLTHILVTRNRPRFLRKALTRFIEAKRPDSQFIVADGGSGLEVAAVVAEFRDVVDVFVSRPDTCSADAFNMALPLATGEYVRLETDDDIIHPARLNQALGVLDMNPALDVLVCGGVKRTLSHYSTICIPSDQAYGDTHANILRWGACGVGFIMRRTVFGHLTFDPDNIMTDLDFILRCLDHGRQVRFLRINLYEHQIYNHSMLVRASDEATATKQALYEKYGVQLDKTKRGLGEWDGGLNPPPLGVVEPVLSMAEEAVA